MYFFHVNNNDELMKVVKKNQGLFADKSGRKIVVTNMSRKEGGVFSETAGVDTYCLVESDK